MDRNQTMENQSINIEKFVDHYLSTQNHPQKPPPCHHCTSSTLCPQHIKGPLSRNDIDLLQLMNPHLTPQHHMSQILHLYHKQLNLRSRQQKNSPMQLALTTRQIFPLAQTPACDQDDEDDQISHNQQFQVDINEQQHIRRLREECYLKLGKMIISRVSKSNKVELDKVNYHTRQYLLPHAQQKIQKLQEQQDQQSRTCQFYALASDNSVGLNFQHAKMPQGLDSVLDAVKYRQIICTINEIIQRAVYEHKKASLANRSTSSLYVWLMVGLFVLISVLLTNSLHFHSQVVQMCCLVGSLCLILFILMFSCHQFHKKLPYVPLVNRIHHSITQYLNYLNSRPGNFLYWQIPRHLYWIQITLTQDNHRFLHCSSIR